MNWFKWAFSMRVYVYLDNRYVVFVCLYVCVFTLYLLFAVTVGAWHFNFFVAFLQSLTRVSLLVILWNSMPDFLALHYLKVCSDSHPFSWWNHPTISSSVALFSCTQSFTASGGQSIGVQLQHESFHWIFRVISFNIDLFDLLAVQGTFKSLLLY